MAVEGREQAVAGREHAVERREAAVEKRMWREMERREQLWDPPRCVTM